MSYRKKKKKLCTTIKTIFSIRVGKVLNLFQDFIAVFAPYIGDKWRYIFIAVSTIQLMAPLTGRLITRFDKEKSPDSNYFVILNCHVMVGAVITGLDMDQIVI